jgi:hypothetical protein
MNILKFFLSILAPGNQVSKVITGLKQEKKIAQQVGY